MKQQITINVFSILIAMSMAQLPMQEALSATPNRMEGRGEKKTESAKDNFSVENLSHWMTYYYMNPEPDKLVPYLLFADKEGLLQGDSAAPLQSFASRVMAQNPDKVKEWFTKMGPMSEAGKTMVLTSIWWSNTKEGKELLETIASSLPEKSKIEFHKQIDSAPPAIEEMDIASPDVLDMLWACFSATGDTKYVTRLMSTLTWGKSDSKDLPRMLIASAARWSLVSNINQHAKVKDCCESTEKSDATLKPFLEKVLSDASEAAVADKEKQAAAEKEKAAKDAENKKESHKH